jgi:hypothetical protein
MEYYTPPAAPAIGITPIIAPPPITAAQLEPPLNRTVGTLHIGEFMPAVVAAILARSDRRRRRQWKRGLDD